MRIEAEFGFLPCFFRRERPRGDIHALTSAIDRVGTLGIWGARVVHVCGRQDTRGDDHAALEAGGDDSVVEEVLEVHARDRHDVGLRKRRCLRRGHLMFVGRGVGGEQAGQAHGECSAVRGGTHVAVLSGGVGLVEGNVG